MGRIQPGVTLPNGLWEKFKEKSGNRKASKELEKLIANDLEDYEFKETIEILNSPTLTDKQEELARKLIEKEGFPYSKTQVANIARENRIYNRSDFVKSANETLAKDSNTPFEFENGKLVCKPIKCNCGVSNTIASLEKLDYKCPNCEAEFKLGV